MPASSCVASKPYANPRTYPTAAPTPTPRSDNPVETIAAPTQSEIGRRSNPYITARKKRIYAAVNNWYREDVVALAVQTTHRAHSVEKRWKASAKLPRLVVYRCQDKISVPAPVRPLSATCRSSFSPHHL